MYIQLNNYHYANEILYVLKSVQNNTNSPISKLGMQKLLYLSASLAPIKEVVLSIIKFLSYKRGPYSKEIQNTLDHLVAYNLVEITEFKIYSEKSASALYKITNDGIKVADMLIKYNKEEEVNWWIDIIVRISNLYAIEIDMESTKEFSGIEKIVKLVYQDPTFKNVKENQVGSELIDLSLKEGLTYELIQFFKKYQEKHNVPKFINDRCKIEFYLLTFFEFLFSKYLDEIL